MARVSVTVSQKPKPEKTFKFLRRDEGRLSYSYAPGSTPNAGTTPSTPRHASPQGESASEQRKALKDAIANDMHHRKGHDPFGDLVIAVPKKAPPPNLAPAAANNTAGDNNTGKGASAFSAPSPSAKRAAVAPARQPVKRREWVDVEVPPPPPPPPAQMGVSTPRDPSDRPLHRDDGGRPASASSGQVPPYHPGHSHPDRASSATRAASTERGGSSSAASYRPHPGDEYYRGRSSTYADPHRDIPPPSAGARGAPVDEEDDRYAGGLSSSSPSSLLRRPASAPRRTFDDDYAAGGYGGYFHRPARPHSVGPSSHAEEQVVQQLERELEAARYERQHFLDAKRQLEEERKRFDAYRAAAQGDLDYAKSRLEADRKEMQRDVQKDSRSLEERHRASSTLLEQERENNKRLTQENDLLTAQLNELTTAMRESQRVQKAEIARLRRDVDSLTHRNRELLAMARQSQIEALQASHDYASTVSSGAPHAMIASSAAAMDTGAGSGSHGTVGVPPLQLLTVSPTGGPGSASTRTGSVTERKTTSAKGGSGKTMTRSGNALAEMEANSLGAKSDELRQRREDAARRQQEGALTPTKKKDIAKQRAGHPVTTPRIKSSAGAPASSSSTGYNHPSSGSGAVAMSGGGMVIPTKEDLLGDVDPLPVTDFPNDAIVSRNALGQNPNKREVLYRSGKREIHYANGTTKIVLPTGHSILNFVNGDVKRTYPDGRSTYWYHEAQTMHTQLPDGTELFEFHATGQTERHLPSGEKDILYPDGIYKVVRVDGTDETFFPPNAIGAKSVAAA